MSDTIPVPRVWSYSASLELNGHIVSIRWNDPTEEPAFNVYVDNEFIEFWKSFEEAEAFVRGYMVAPRNAKRKAGAPVAKEPGILTAFMPAHTAVDGNSMVTGPASGSWLSDSLSTLTTST